MRIWCHQHFRKRGRTVCSTSQLLRTEEHLLVALQSCNYTSWTFNRMRTEKNTQKKPSDKYNIENPTEQPKRKKAYMVVPYTKDIYESKKNICNKHVIQMNFNGSSTIKNFMVASKDRDTITQKSGVVYRHECRKEECDEVYIRELARTFEEKFKEYLKALSSIDDLHSISGHPITVDNFSTVGRGRTRTLSEQSKIQFI